MKKLLKKIPFIGPLLTKINGRLKARKFKSSQDYWVERYKTGGNSGEGSYNRFAEYKAEIINDFVAKNNVKSVIEFGCGDGNQLSYFKIGHFTGYDVSPAALDLCRKRFEGDSTKEFYLSSDYKSRQADLTLSLDVVYCLVEQTVYELYMQRLFESSSKYVIVYSSDFDAHHDSLPHIRHRKFTDWVKTNQPQFKLISQVPNRFEEHVAKSSNSQWYIFERI